MISLDDYTDHDGLGLADLVATKQVTARELFETAVAAIERINPQINAVCRTLPNDAEKAMTAKLPGPGGRANRPSSPQAERLARHLIKRAAGARGAKVNPERLVG